MAGSIGGLRPRRIGREQCHDRAGGPVKRAEFIMSEMKQGIDKIEKVEDSAPMPAELQSAPQSA